MRWHNFIERCPQHNLLALRALFATILAITITELFALPRNYWSILAIISVSTSIHSKEIIFRSKAIIINTITGCLLGTLLFYYLNLYVPFPVIISITLMLALLNLYFAVVNYPVGVFLTVYLLSCSLAFYLHGTLVYLLPECLILSLGRFAFYSQAFC